MFNVDLEKFLGKDKKEYRNNIDKERIIRLTRFLFTNARKIDTIQHINLPRDELFLICFLFSSFIFFSEDRLPKDGSKVIATVEYDGVQYGDEDVGTWIVKIGMTMNLIYEIRRRVSVRDVKLAKAYENLFQELEEILELDNGKILNAITAYIISKILQKKEEGKIVTNYIQIDKPMFSLLVGRNR